MNRRLDYRAYLLILTILLLIILGVVVYWTLRTSYTRPVTPTPEASPTPSSTATLLPTVRSTVTATKAAEAAQLQPSAQPSVTPEESFLPPLASTASTPVFQPPAVMSSETQLPTLAWMPTLLASLTLTPTALPTVSATSTLSPTSIPSPTLLPPPLPVAVAPLTSPQRQTFRYMFPVQPSDVTNYAAAHHDYPATDIFAPEWTTFVAVTDGTIEEVSRVDTWSATNDELCTRGGLSVSLVGDDGVRYYGSHLREIASGIEPGIRVVAGEVLGFVGNSGNAQGIAFHLHFGISRPTGINDCGVRRGEVWPYNYLNDWKASESATPILPN